MELTEISDRLDVKLKSFEGGISADEYEKSLYLSKVQKDIYYGLLSIFEQNGIITNTLKPFVLNAAITASATVTPDAISGAQYFVLPIGVEKIIYETAELDIVSDPLLHQRITRVYDTKAAEMAYKQDNPFREPNKDETLKIISQKTSSENSVELHAIADISTYRIKYFKTIHPIILENLPTGLSIDAIISETNTEFNDDVLTRIIDGAALAILQNSAIQQNV